MKIYVMLRELTYVLMLLFNLSFTAISYVGKLFFGTYCWHAESNALEDGKKIMITSDHQDWCEKVRIEITNSGRLYVFKPTNPNERYCITVNSMPFMKFDSINGNELLLKQETDFGNTSV